jgi:hypothetical protein
MIYPTQSLLTQYQLKHFTPKFCPHISRPHEVSELLEPHLQTLILSPGWYCTVLYCTVLSPIPEFCVRHYKLKKKLAII